LKSLATDCQIKQGKMGRTFSMYEKVGNAYRILDGKLEGEM
jgi:hypothetical protein